MGRTMKFDSPTRLSKFRKTMNSMEGSTRLSLRDWKKGKNRNAIDMELLTELPVPTVPPYPIEYFEPNESGLSHVNMAFKFTEETTPPPSSIFTSDRLNSAFDLLPTKREETNDNISKSSSIEDSRESVGGSTADSGVVLHSSESRRTSGNSNDFRTSPDGRAEREHNVDTSAGLTAIVNGVSNNSCSDQALNSYSVGYPAFPMRPVPCHSRTSSGTSQPISNGSLLHTSEQANKFRSAPSAHNPGNYQDLRGVVPLPAFRPPVRVSSMPAYKEHTYVNRPPIPAPPMDDIGPPPYPGTVQPSKFTAYRPPHLKRVEPAQPLPLLGSQIRSQLWQGSAATPKPCGRSKSVHGEFRKTDSAHRSRLGSINTLGIPYQTTLPARLPKKTIPSYSEATRRLHRAPNRKPDLVVKVPLNKVKVTSQPSSPFKKAITPVYSKVCKQKKTKKPNVPYEGLNSKLLGNNNGPAQSYSSTGTTKVENLKGIGNAKEDPLTTPKPKPLVGRSRSEDGLLSADSFSSPLYEELLHLNDDLEEDEETGQYSIEVRIDYSKGTKYKIEKRRRPAQSNSDNNNNSNIQNEIGTTVTDGPLVNNVKNVQNDTSISSEKMKQFRKEKKGKIAGKLRSNSDAIGLKNRQFLDKFKKMTICCCG